MSYLAGYTGHRSAAVVAPVTIKDGVTSHAAIQSRAPAPVPIASHPTTRGVFNSTLTVQKSSSQIDLESSVCGPRVRPSQSRAAPPSNATSNTHSAKSSFPKSVYQEQCELAENTIVPYLRNRTPPRSRKNIMPGGSDLQDCSLSRGATLQSSTRIAYGLNGDNPRQHMPLDAMEISRRATTADLLDGTCKSAGHIPGYTGHLPRSAANKNLVHVDDERRRHTKDNVAMVMNFNAPGYTGHVPQGVGNRSVQRQKNIVTDTVSGSAHQQFATQDYCVDKDAHRKAAVVSFFSGGSAWDAETFYSRFRPFEGRMSM